MDGRKPKSLLPAAVGWRLQLLRRYWFLLRHFRNGGQMIQALRRGLPCDQAVLRDGSCLRHPKGRTGFVPTLLEIWYERVYTPAGFYKPRPGDVVVDVGANVGLFAVWIARRSPACRIFALEPFPENYAFLEENLRSAGCGSATAYPIALGGRSGAGAIVSGGDRSLDHRLTADVDASGGLQVKVVSLKDLSQLVHSDRIALLKMDIEGSEYDAFSEMESGAVDCVQCMAIEYHEHLRPGVLALLRKRLQDTHDLEVQPEPLGRYGMILARRK
ncbi:MAG TPA: FkbM family methyltransferase [Gemmataceae bacterium]|nr:FkbM family methyltransferase [Gemmataceae bacterium]